MHRYSEREWENALKSFENQSVKEYKKRYRRSPPNRVTAMTHAYTLSTKKRRRTIPRNFTQNDWKSYRNLRAIGWNSKSAANFISSVKALKPK